jgi:hypothetical protein
VYPQRPLQRVLQNLQEELLQDFRSRLEIAPVKEGAPLDVTSRSHALSVLEECQAHVFGSYQARIAAGDNVHVTTQAEFLDGADIDLTFEQGLPCLSFDEDVCADAGYAVK